MKYKYFLVPVSRINKALKYLKKQQGPYYILGMKSTLELLENEMALPEIDGSLGVYEGCHVVPCVVPKTPGMVIVTNEPGS